MTAPRSAVLEARDEDAAIEALHRDRRTDGLPVIVPTPERVDRMLLHSNGLDADLVIGAVPPGGGLLTVEKAAINAVMAGCTAEMFPLVIAACEALVDPLFDAGPLQSTTHCVTPLIIVNGPAREMYGVHSGVGALGPGHRVNATLGRAVRLIMLNVGNGIPGIGDMATLGSPAKFSCCFAEAEEESPFPPFHVSRGFDAEDSTVTLLGVEGPHSLIFSIEDADRDGDTFLRSLAAGFSNPVTNNIFFGQGMVAAVLNPVHSRLLARCGFTRESAQRRLFELAVASRAALRDLVGDVVDIAPGEEDLLRIVKRPEDILILTGGAEGGGYSAFFPSWGGGADGNHAVTKRVRFDPGCELPESRRAGPAEHENAPGLVS